MEHGGWKRWIVPALAVVFVLWLLARARSGGGGLAQMFTPGGSGGSSLPSDVSRRQGIAEDLQLEQLKKQFAYEDAVRNLELSVQRAQAQTVTDYASLYDDLATGKNYPGGFRCPQGGKPRIDPQTGRIVCMQTNQSGGFFTPFVNTLQQWANSWLAWELPKPKASVPKTSGGGGGGYGPYTI
jgi:hypothetical protein